MRPDKLCQYLHALKRGAGSLIVFALIAGGPLRAADMFIEKAGIKGGVVVQLGCSDMTLLKGLHDNQAFLICGLDKDPD